MCKKAGFTLVELMIVVAIIGVLAAIAIPNFVDMQYRSKRAEIPPNVDAIKTAELSYEAEYDDFIEVAEFQPATIGKELQAWTVGSNFDTLGWKPSGEVRGQYMVQTALCFVRYGDKWYQIPCPDGFIVFGRIDVDGDANFAEYDASREINATLFTDNDVY